MKKYIIFSMLILLLFCGFSMYYNTHRNAQVREVNGLCIFLYANPVDEYEFLGTVKSPAIVVSTDMDKMIILMTKKAKDKYPEADAVLFSNNDIYNCEAIRFK